MRTMTVAAYVTQQLARWGIKRIYGVAGDAILPWLDQLGKQQDIRYVPCRHEAAAAMMASAEAKLTGRPAVCAATSGPGTVNLLNGLADAQIDRVPVIAITGQVETHKLGTGYKQDLRQQTLLSSLSHYTTLVANPDAIGTVLQKAFATSIERRGVSHLSICRDVFLKSTAAMQADELPRPARQLRWDRLELEQGLEWINEAKRPVLLVGAGARRVGPYVAQFAAKTGAAVILSLGAKGVLADSHPHVVGGVGTGGSEAALVTLAEADLLIILGATWFPRRFFPDGIRIVQVDEAGSVSRPFTAAAGFGQSGRCPAALDKAVGGAAGWKQAVDSAG